MNKLLKDKVELSKIVGKPMDAKNLMKLIPSLDSEDKKLLYNLFVQASEYMGNVYLDRALSEGTITEKEWLKWQKDYGMTPMNIAVLLQAYYNKIDGNTPDDSQINVLTCKNSDLYIHRKIFEKKFGIKIVCIQKMLKNGLCTITKPFLVQAVFLHKNPNQSLSLAR